jgi:hypothetical protein
MSQVFNKCATRAQPMAQIIFAISTLLLPMVGFKLTILGLRVQCSATALPGHNEQPSLILSFPLSASSGIQTLDLKLMSVVFNHCATWAQIIP